MALDKIETTLEWPKLKCKKDIQMFLGFTNIYRLFFEGFERNMKSMTGLLGNCALYEWPPEFAKAFQDFKGLVTIAPILKHFKPICQIVVETNTSDFVNSVVLFYVIDVQLHPIAFYSRIMNKVEIKFDIHDKELHAIFGALTEWRWYLEGAHLQIQIHTDH